eukprot:TRINITY_DN3153_c0_g1_i1.p1 TRINITY_DN3153_c0_g1~~TRINITY_DN3153_c0_g1_i1.p1  ORF type:complete len:287 (-),score=42.10 TRINITY_DN3153_c0_g1_i1:26-886(-)
MRLLRNLLLGISLISLIFGYKPVVMFHGFGGSSHDFDDLIQFINETHPGTIATSLPLFPGEDSVWTTMDAMVEGVINSLLSLNYPSYHLMCHSQGALVCRTVLQRLPNSGVDTFISLSGPHMGQYGLIPNIQKYFPSITTEYAYDILYTFWAQDVFSAANYWNDPLHQSEYLKDVRFLPIVNNQTFNPDSQDYRNNFIQTKKVVLLGGPDDGVIKPWQSAFFGFWNDDATKIIPMEDQTLYDQDWIGLRALNASGRLFQHAVPNVYHMDWLDKRKLFDEWIAPLLT